MKKSKYAYLNDFPIVDFLSLVGHKVHRVYRAEHVYFSPLREEKTPSFSVNVHSNVWIDFGLGGAGGKLLALAQRLFNTDFTTAARITAQLVAGWQRPAPVEAPLPVPEGLTMPPVVPTCKKRVVRITELRDKILMEYLVNDRGIDLNAVMKCPAVWERLREVHYWSNDAKDGTKQVRPNWSIGLLNEGGGYELFSKDYQSSLGGKSFTFIPGKQSGVAIFESAIDLLSAITKTYKRLKGKWSGFQMSVIVLNSIKFRKQARDLVRTLGSIFYYGDNDKAGQETAAYYRKECKGQDFYDERQKFRGYKDYNDWLLGKKAAPGDLPARGQAPSVKAQTSKRWVWAVFDDTATGQERECTYYNYTNDQAGKEHLKVLRNRFSDDVKVIRLCTRTSGRGFTYEQLFVPTGRITTQDSPRHRPGQCQTLPDGGGGWGRPGTVAWSLAGPPPVPLPVPPPVPPPGAGLHHVSG